AHVLHRGARLVFYRGAAHLVGPRVEGDLAGDEDEVTVTSSLCITRRASGCRCGLLGRGTRGRRRFGDQVGGDFHLPRRRRRGRRWLRWRRLWLLLRGLRRARLLLRRSLAVRLRLLGARLVRRVARALLDPWKSESRRAACRGERC